MGSINSPLFPTHNHYTPPAYTQQPTYPPTYPLFLWIKKPLCIAKENFQLFQGAVAECRIWNPSALLARSCLLADIWL